MKDDVADDVKGRRLQEIIELQKSIGRKKLEAEVGRTVEILIEGVSRKSGDHFSGRTDKGQIVILPCGRYRVGEFVTVCVTRAEGHSLFAEPAGVA
jgi:tRNA-2-methylthio-N6-dimethylallyladenosine synthase